MKSYYIMSIVWDTSYCHPKFIAIVEDNFKVMIWNEATIR